MSTAVVGILLLLISGLAGAFLYIRKLRVKSDESVKKLQTATGEVSSLQSSLKDVKSEVESSTQKLEEKKAKKAELTPIAVDRKAENARRDALEKMKNAKIAELSAKQKQREAEIAKTEARRRAALKEADAARAKAKAARTEANTAITNAKRSKQLADNAKRIADQRAKQAGIEISRANTQQSQGSLQNGQYGLLGGRNKKWCADENHRGRITCSRGGIGDSERFTVHNLGNNQVALKGGRDGKWCADEGDRVVCNRNGIGGSERFTVKNLGNNEFALKGGRNGKWCADEKGRIICNRGGIGAWERFKFQPVSAPPQLLGKKLVEAVKQSPQPHQITARYNAVPGYFRSGFKFAGDHFNIPDPNVCKGIAQRTRVPVWGHRNNLHPDKKYKNSCYFYHSGPKYAGDGNDRIHMIGCAFGGNPKTGCSAPPIIMKKVGSNVQIIRRAANKSARRRRGCGRGLKMIRGRCVRL